MKMVMKGCICTILLFFHVAAFSLANPAAVNCVNQGLNYVLIKSTGICLFSDGSYCEEWAYFRGKCAQGQNQFPGGKFQKNNLSQYCVGKSGDQTVVQLCPGKM